MIGQVGEEALLGFLLGPLDVLFGGPFVFSDKKDHRAPAFLMPFPPRAPMGAKANEPAAH